MKVSKLDSDYARQLYNILQIGFNSQSIVLERKTETAESTEQIPLLTQPVYSNAIVAGRVILDTSTGICPATDIKLEVMSFTKDKRNDLYTEILRLSRELYGKSPEYKRSDNTERASIELKKFGDWLLQ